MKQLEFWENKVSEKIVNISSIPKRSPFRYPGGKTWLIPKIRQWMLSFSRKPELFVEPFAGGGIVGLTTAFEDLANSIILVEIDEQVASVWETIINNKNDAEWLANKIAHFELNTETVKNLFSHYSNSYKDIAFKTIIQNRINHGGILANGAGTLKKGENGKGILSRWYPQTLKKRILEISKIKNPISFIKGDGFQIIQEHINNNDVVFFVDPPYTVSRKKAGSRLYKYHQVDHEKLFELMANAKGNFLMTYDNAEEVHLLAKKYKFETQLVAMNNTHHAKMSELLIGRDLSWLK